MVMFIDDILIYSKSDEEHPAHMKVVLQTMKEKKLYVKLSKFEFWLEEMSSLCHVISSGCIIVVPSKMDAVLWWETVKSITKIIIFLGLTSYCKSFIEGLLKLTLPFNHLTRKGQTYVWEV